MDRDTGQNVTWNERRLHAGPADRPLIAVPLAPLPAVRRKAGVKPLLPVQVDVRAQAAPCGLWLRPAGPLPP